MRIADLQRGHFFERGSMIIPDALVPLLEGDTAPHFKAAGEGRLVVPHCKDCGHHWFPGAAICPRCLSENVDWATLSGRATLWSWCEFHRPYFKAVKGKVPYVVVAAALEEGPQLYGNLVESDAGNLKIGMRLEAVFTPAENGAGMVNFRTVDP